MLRRSASAAAGLCPDCLAGRRGHDRAGGEPLRDRQVTRSQRPDSGRGHGSRRAKPGGRGGGVPALASPWLAERRVQRIRSAAATIWGICRKGTTRSPWPECGWRSHDAGRATGNPWLESLLRRPALIRSLISRSRVQEAGRRSRADGSIVSGTPIKEFLSNVVRGLAPLAGRGHLVPQAAVQVDVVPAGLAGCRVADIRI
jgi:hypothetical protein